MKTHRHLVAVSLCLMALGSLGCHHRVVSAAMPAPLPPHPINQPQAQPDVAPPVIPPPSDSVHQAPLPPPDPEPVPAAPAANRAPARATAVPAEADAAKPRPEPGPEAPVIAPVLSKQELANAVRLTNSDQSSAQRTLDRARARRLNASQADLYDKVKGFLAQTEDAKHANDWVRAQNLAHKAQILALELMKSL